MHKEEDVRQHNQDQYPAWDRVQASVCILVLAVLKFAKKSREPNIGR